MAKNLRQSGPSLSLCLLAAVISVLLGALIGMISLVTREVKTVDKLPPPAQAIPGEVYFVQGALKGGEKWRRTRDLLQRERAFEFVLTEAEINQWAAGMIKSELARDEAKRKKEKEEEEKLTPEQRVMRDKRDLPGQRKDPSALDVVEGNKETKETKPGTAGGDGSFIPKFDFTKFERLFPLLFGSPNFRLSQDSLQVGVVVGMERLAGHASQFQVTGVLERDSAGAWAFTPRAGQLGRAPLGLQPELLNFIWHYYETRLLNSPEGQFLRPIWSRIETISVEDGLVRFTVRPSESFKGTLPPAPGGSAQRVPEALAAYRSAVLAKQGAEALSWIQPDSLSAYQKYVELARTGTKEVIGRLPITDRYQVLLLRQCLSAEQLTTGDAGSLLQSLISGGYFNSEFHARLNLGVVEENGPLARADLIAQGQRTAFVWEFALNGDRWQLDLHPVFQAQASFILALAKEGNQQENEALLAALRSVSGKALADSIWNPVAPLQPETSR